MTKSKGAQKRERRQKLLVVIENRLYQTAWGRHYARPSQIRAGAKKLLDRARADLKRLKAAKAKVEAA